MFYIKLIFVALYDVPIIRFDGDIFGNSKKVHLLLYRCYKAFCDVLTLYFIMNLAIKRINCQHWQQKSNKKRPPENSDGLIFLFHFVKHTTIIIKNAIIKKAIIFSRLRFLLLAKFVFYNFSISFIGLCAYNLTVFPCFNNSRYRHGNT